MSYSDNLQSTENFTGFMIKVSPRIWLKPAMFNNFSAPVYRIRNWQWPKPRKLSNETIDLAEVSTTMLSANQWYYDESQKDLYVRVDSVNLTTQLKYLMCEFEIYHSTFEKMWFRDPTNENSEAIFWPGDILTTPEISISTQNVRYGFVLADASGFDVSNAQDVIGKVLHAGSYKYAECKVWHVVGDPDEVSSYSLIFTGAIDGRVEADFEKYTFPLVNRVGVLNGQIPYQQIADVSEKYDPSLNGAIITFALGKGGWFRAINASSTAITGSPTTAYNRAHTLFYGASKDGAQIFKTSRTAAVSMIFGNTLILSSSDDAKHFKVGDKVVLDPVSGSNFYAGVFDVSGAVITLDSPSALSGAGTLTKYAVEQVALYQNGVRRFLTVGRDYSVVFQERQIRVLLTSSCESNVGASTFDPENGDFVAATFHPWPNSQTFNGSPFTAVYPGTDEPYPDVYESIYFYLKAICGVSEADIDVVGLQALRDEFGDDLTSQVFPGSDRFAGPVDKVTALNLLLKNCECIAFYDPEGKISVRKASERSAAIDSIDLEEIEKDQWSYLVDYSDIKNEEIPGQPGAISLQPSKQDVLSGADPAGVVVTDESARSTFVTDDKVLSLHKESGFTTDDIRYSDRRGLLSLKVPFRLANKNLGQCLTVKSTRMLGFDFDPNIKRERDFMIKDIRWTDTGTFAVLEDLFDAEVGA